MKIMTDYIGEVEYFDKDVIHMERGLYGFETVTDYILIQNPDRELPYMWLQALNDEHLIFIVTNPFYFVSDYDFELPDMAINKLQIEGVKDVQILSIVVIPEKVEDTTINLKSPVILNQRLNKAQQIILDGQYNLRYKIFSEEA